MIYLSSKYLLFLYDIKEKGHWPSSLSYSQNSPYFSGTGQRRALPGTINEPLVVSETYSLPQSAGAVLW